MKAMVIIFCNSVSFVVVVNSYVCMIKLMIKLSAYCKNVGLSTQLLFLISLKLLIGPKVTFQEQQDNVMYDKINILTCK